MTSPREQFKNDATTTLNGGINNSTTSVVATDGSVFPATGNFRVRVDDEIMLATARSSNTLTVVRASESTSAASHSDLAPIRLVATAGSLAQTLLDNTPHANTSRPPFHKMTNAAGTILTSADFSWVNQGSTSVADQDGGLFFTVPGNATNMRMFVRSAPSTPYTVIVALDTLWVGNDDIEPGLVFRESGTSKLIHLTNFTNNADQEIGVFRYTDEDSFTSTALNVDAEMYEPTWLKIEDDGTTLKFYISKNGINWLQIHSEARGSFFTSAPNQIGIGILQKNTTIDTLCNVLAWSEQ